MIIDSLVLRMQLNIEDQSTIQCIYIKPLYYFNPSNIYLEPYSLKSHSSRLLGVDDSIIDCCSNVFDVLSGDTSLKYLLSTFTKLKLLPC